LKGAAGLAEAVGALLGDLRPVVAREVLASVADERRAVAERLASDRRGGLEALEALANRAHRLFRERLRERAGRAPLARARVAIDDLLATDETELLDRDDVPDETRREIIESLARFNRAILAYRRFAGLVAPLAEAAAARRGGRPVRILELGSGHGELAFHLVDWAAARGLAVEVTASDYADVYVELGNRAAAARKAPVRYLKLNAFDIGLESGSQDVVLMTQTLHHFSPGQLARLFAEATRVGASALLIDGWRSLPLLVALGITFAALFPRSARHDAMISTRKFYSAPELALLAGLTPAAARSRVFFAPPGYSVVRFDAA
jgi:SAM-dependent methyltransferase